MTNLFTKHPASVNETYFQHLRFASTASFRLFFAACACFIHAIFPFLFIDTTSNLVAKMTACFCQNERKKPFLKKVKSYNPNHDLEE